MLSSIAGMIFWLQVCQGAKMMTEMLLMVLGTIAHAMHANQPPLHTRLKGQLLFSLHPCSDKVMLLHEPQSNHSGVLAL